MIGLLARSRCGGSGQRVRIADSALDFAKRVASLNDCHGKFPAGGSCDGAGYAKTCSTTGTGTAQGLVESYIRRAAGRFRALLSRDSAQPERGHGAQRDGDSRIRLRDLAAHLAGRVRRQGLPLLRRHAAEAARSRRRGRHRGVDAASSTSRSRSKALVSVASQCCRPSRTSPRGHHPRQPHQSLSRSSSCRCPTTACSPSWWSTVATCRTGSSTRAHYTPRTAPGRDLPQQQFAGKELRTVREDLVGELKQTGERLTSSCWTRSPSRSRCSGRASGGRRVRDRGETNLMEFAELSNWRNCALFDAFTASATSSTCSTSA